MIWQQENEFLSVSLAADGAITVWLKAENQQFCTGTIALQENNPVDLGHVWLRTDRSVSEQYPGRFLVEAIDEQSPTLRVTLYDDQQMGQRRAIGQFTIQPRLDGDWFELAITAIDDSIPSLVFPPPWEADSLVIPQGVGKWLREPLRYPSRRLWVYPVHLNMRWFGGLIGKFGWITVLDRGYQHGGLLAAELSASPAWLKSHGQWRDLPRTIRIRFQRGGYVELAKTFRAYAIDHGLFRALRDKIADRPALANVRGGRQLSLMLAESIAPERYQELMQPVPPGLSRRTIDPTITFAQAAVMVEQARALGMARGTVNIRGWINGGYDESHPDVWPPESALGSIAELKALLASPDPILSVLHDNYQDMYTQSPSFPGGIIRTQNGDLLRGGVWAGGQSYIINSRDSLRYAERNWSDLRTLSPRGMFIDTVTATQFYENYEPGSELTRDQDEVHKRALLQFFLDQGQVVSSEEGQDFGVPYVDWFENRHRHIPGESIPLWPLVFHDAAFCTRYNTQAASPDPKAPFWLADLLWGYTLLWDIRSVEGWTALAESFTSTFHVDRWHERIGMDEMLDHRYLTDDRWVEQTTFTNGTITVNFSDQPRTIDDLTLPAYGYHIMENS